MDKNIILLFLNYNKDRESRWCDLMYEYYYDKYNPKVCDIKALIKAIESEQDCYNLKNFISNSMFSSAWVYVMVENFNTTFRKEFGMQIKETTTRQLIQTICSFLN